MSSVFITCAVTGSGNTVDKSDKGRQGPYLREPHPSFFVNLFLH